MHAALIAFDGFTDVDLFLLWDLLNRARRPGWGVRILGEAEAHTSAAGLRVATHGRLREAREADAVLVVSGPATRRLCRDPAWLGQLTLEPERQLVGSMCSGALILAAKGLLQGRPATTYPTARAELESFGVEVVEQAFVRHGGVATAAGCLAGLQLAGWVLEEKLGGQVRELVLRSVQPVGAGLSFQDAPALAQLYRPAP